MLLALRRRFAGRPDTEHEQAFVRLTLVSLVALYFLPDALATLLAGDLGDTLFVWALAALLTNAAGILAHIAVRPAVCIPRRVYGVAFDIAAVSFFLWLSGLKGLPLTLLYVWITIANGFRFGPRYLLLSAGFTLVGFSITIVLSPWWSSHIHIGLSFLLITTVLSSYVLSLVRKLFDAIGRAESANVAKRRFVSNISHEMRTPLNAVVNLSQLLSQTELKRDQRDLLDTISSASQALMQLINDVLDFSKIEAGKLQIERIPFDLHAFVNSTCRMFHPQAELKGLRMHTTIMPEVPHALIGDPHHLRQVLMNLVGNAMKFTEHGRVTLEVSVLSDRADEVKLRFAVLDTGIGMDKVALARVFESFSQAEASISRKFGGTGLGTTIAKQLVELMGGRMGVESTEGVGSTFWFELAFAKSTAEPAATVGPMRRGTVLLVAFAEPLSSRFQAMFESSECKVEAVTDIEQAILRAERAEAPVSCVLVRVNDASTAQSVGATYHARTHRNRPPLLVCIDRISPSERSVCLAVGYTSIIEPAWPDTLIFNAVRSAIVTETSADSDPSPPPSGADRVSFRILVVDDTAINLVVAKKVLAQAGHTAICVASAEEALETLERERYAFDLVITDLHMPGMDGIALTRSMQLLTRGLNRRLPVIVLTADVTPEARAEVLAAGADTMLGKPINAKELIRTIVELNPVGSKNTHTAGEKAVSTAMPESEIVDLKVLGALASLDDDGGLVGRLIDRYIKETQRALALCREAAEGGDSGALRVAMEEMIVLAASIGARAMIRTCAQLGEPVERVSYAELLGFTDQLERQFTQTRGVLEIYRAARTPTSQ